MAKWVYRAGSRLQLFHVYSAAPHGSHHVTTDKYAGTMLAKSLPEALTVARATQPPDTTLIGIGLAAAARTPSGEAVTLSVGVLYPDGLFLPDVLPARFSRGTVVFPRLPAEMAADERRRGSG